MKLIPMSDNDLRALIGAIAHARRWSSEHQWEIGIAEMALGAGLLAAGVHNGAIEMGTEIVGSLSSKFNLASGIGGAIGGSIGAGAGGWLGSIGVAALGTAVSVPVGLLIGGGALLFGAFGYLAGDVIHNYLHPPIELAQLLGNASLLVVGTALLVDGARRVIKDKRVRAAASRVRERVVYLREVTVEVVAASLPELTALLQDKAAVRRLIAVGAGGIGSAAVAGTSGVAIGSSLAAGTVTVLGSHTIGAAALSLGFVSAPIWPALLLGAVGAGVGYAGWRACRTRLIDLFAT